MALLSSCRVGKQPPEGEESFRERVKNPKILGKAYLGSGQHPKEIKKKKEEMLHLPESVLRRAGKPNGALQWLHSDCKRGGNSGKKKYIVSLTDNLLTLSLLTTFIFMCVSLCV